MHPYRPEGVSVRPPGIAQLRRAADSGEILQAMCTKCDEHHNLHVDLGGWTGIIRRQETGIRGGDFSLMTRVGKPVSFQVLRFETGRNPVLSRRTAQLEARSYFLNTLHPGDILPARVQNVADFGVFCDIGCGFSALMRLDRCCISRLPSTKALFRPGQPICAAVLAIDDRNGFVHLTGRELLGTWEENAEKFRQSQTVTGTVRSILPYGIFIELLPNLSGLAEPTPGLEPGDPVSVHIRAILKDKHKIKLTVLEKLPAPIPLPAAEYFITSGHIGRWEYYPGSPAVTYF